MSDKRVMRLSDAILEKIYISRFDGVAIPRPLAYGAPDPGLVPEDMYLLNGGEVLPIIEKLVAVAVTVQQLLQCAGEIAKGIESCSSLFQEAHVKMQELEKVVGDA